MRRVVHYRHQLDRDAHQDEPNTALAGSTGARPTQSNVLKVAKAIYRTHNRPPLPSWDHTSQKMRDFTLAQAWSAIHAVTAGTAADRERRDRVNHARRLARLRVAAPLDDGEDDADTEIRHR